MDQIEFGLRKLVFTNIEAPHRDRITCEVLDEPGVDVDGGHVGTTAGHPLDQRPATRTDLEAFPAGADSQFVEQRLAAIRIPQLLNARQPLPLLVEALPEDIVARHDWILAHGRASSSSYESSKSRASPPHYGGQHHSDRQSRSGLRRAEARSPVRRWRSAMV